MMRWKSRKAFFVSIFAEVDSARARLIWRYDARYDENIAHRVHVSLTSARH